MKELLTTIAALVLVGCGPSVDNHEAARTGNIEVVKQYSAAGGDVNAKNKLEETPLHIAAPQGHKEIAELLITKGADVNAKSAAIYTPLHFVEEKDIAKILILNGADVNAISVSGTPLDVAIEENYTETADLLCKHEAKTAEQLDAAGN